MLKIGDKVVKNELNWIPNEFDDWGRGVGIGEVVEPPFDLDNGDVDVRWENGTFDDNITVNGDNGEFYVGDTVVIIMKRLRE